MEWERSVFNVNSRLESLWWKTANAEGETVHIKNSFKFTHKRALKGMGMIAPWKDVSLEFVALLVPGL